MKKTYKIPCTLTYQSTIVVEANSIEEAKEKVASTLKKISISPDGPDNFALPELAFEQNVVEEVKTNTIDLTDETVESFAKKIIIDKLPFFADKTIDVENIELAIYNFFQSELVKQIKKDSIKSFLKNNEEKVEEYIEEMEYEFNESAETVLDIVCVEMSRIIYSLPFCEDITTNCKNENRLTKDEIDEIIKEINGHF